MKKGGRPKPRANNPKREAARAKRTSPAHAGVKEALAELARADTQPQRQAKPLNAEPPGAPQAADRRGARRRGDLRCPPGRATPVGGRHLPGLRRQGSAALHAGTELTDLQNAGRWQSTSMPARYSRGQKARGPAAARWPGTTGSTGETLPLCGGG